MKKELSIIVSVYNLEKYIGECLNSINEIRNIDYELIIINDGSKDNSQKIIEEFCKKNKRTKCYIKENGGVSSARNYGLKKAVGEYIWFVDGDDTINAIEFEKFYIDFKDKNLDIAYFKFYTFSEKSLDEKEKYEDLQVKVDKIITGKEYFKLISREHLRNNIVWNKIYRKEFLFKNNLFFEEKIIFEDILYTFFSITVAKRIKYFDFYPYNYRKNRKNSITTHIDQKKASESYLKIIDIWMKNYNKFKNNRIIYNKILNVYIAYLEIVKIRKKDLESKLFKFNLNNLFLIFKFKRKIFVRTYIKKKYK